MAQIETDYLVVGAGASGMAFADTLVANSDADVVLVDRRHRPGGHWVDDYGFVRLHQPSALYGVDSRPLGNDRIDTSGPNAGFYERATGAELCDYYTRVLDEQLMATGRVRFFGMCDYAGGAAGSHRFVSRVTGRTSTVRVRRKLVDATYIQTTTPAHHTPAFSVDPGARVVTPNALVEGNHAGSGYTVLGAGKTSMDTCCWLIDNGVDPEDIRWIRPRDVWTMDRGAVQPLELVGSIVNVFAAWTDAAVEATDPTDFVRRLEGCGSLIRLDPDVEPEIFRGAILSADERTALRSISNVVRLGHVLRIGTDEIELERGSIPTDREQIHVDCTAPGLGMPPERPIFEPDRIIIQRVQFGLDVFSPAMIGLVEATRDDDDEKNRLCPPVPAFGATTEFARDFTRAFLVSQRSRLAWMAEPDLDQWLNATRLGFFRGIAEHLTDPEDQANLMSMMQNTGPALENLDRIVAAEMAEA